MQFLSDVYLRCPDCNGKRFRSEVLEVKYGGRSIADVLELTVSEALAVFAGEGDVVGSACPASRCWARVPAARSAGADALRRRGAAVEAGGAPGGSRKAPVIPANVGIQFGAGLGPGGAGATSKGDLFLFDEPTTGLHFDDVAKLLGAFRRLIAAGHSLIVIEHNLDVIRASDWIIDLGPEGGDAGGEIVCAGHAGRSAGE